MNMQTRITWPRKLLGLAVKNALPKPGELLDQAMMSLGVTTDDGLRDKLRQRYGLNPSQGTVNRWRNAQRGPSYEYAVALLHAAGWLNTGADPRPVPVAPRGPLEQLAEDDEAILLNQREGMRLLRDIHAMLVKQHKGRGSGPRQSRTER
jgi:hypothetical protein